jgi:hypothetical protein
VRLFTWAVAAISPSVTGSGCACCWRPQAAATGWCFVTPPRPAAGVPRAAINTGSGEVIEERTGPGAALAGQTTTSPWDHLSVVYAAGFDLWGYFTTPFALAMPGVRTEEIEPWEEAGEQWRRLKATFPGGFAAHATEQVYSFDSAGLLRRFEYQPRHTGVPANVNYVAEHKQFAGLVIGTRRRMIAGDPDGRSRGEPVLMTVDVVDVQVET